MSSFWCSALTHSFRQAGTYSSTFLSYTVYRCLYVVTVKYYTNHKEVFFSPLNLVSQERLHVHCSETYIHKNNLKAWLQATDVARNFIENWTIWSWWIYLTEILEVSLQYSSLPSNQPKAEKKKKKKGDQEPIQVTKIIKHQTYTSWNNHMHVIPERRDFSMLALLRYVKAKNYL